MTLIDLYTVCLPPCWDTKGCYSSGSGSLLLINQFLQIYIPKFVKTLLQCLFLHYNCVSFHIVPYLEK